MKKDYKEAYEHRRYKNELCPTPEELAAYNPGIRDFEAILDSFYKEAFKLSEEVLACLALALDLPGGEEYFKPITGDSDPQLRILHYPPVPASVIAASAAKDGAGKDGRIRPHCDYSLCTLLFQDSIGGLEIDPFHTGQFIPATPKDGTILINIGDLLHRLLNGRVKSTMHRVVAPEAFTPEDGSEAMLPSRYSIPFFVHPVPEAQIDPILLDPAEEKVYKEVNAGDWRSWRTARNYMMTEKEEYFLGKLGIAHELPRNVAALGGVTAGGY
jgi:isopenicillin N synthase-like dioxygenase